MRFNLGKYGRHPARRGAVIIAALVCVAVAAAVFVSGLKIASAQRHRLETETWQLQAAWLAESGLERAAERLAARADFAGETWSIPAEQLGGSHAAVVRIRIEPVRDQPQSRLVRVQADYPDGPHDRARESREMVVQLPRKGDAERTTKDAKDTKGTKRTEKTVGDKQP